MTILDLLYFADRKRERKIKKLTKKNISNLQQKLSPKIDYISTIRVLFIEYKKEK